MDSLSTPPPEILGAQKSTSWQVKAMLLDYRPELRESPCWLCVTGHNGKGFLLSLSHGPPVPYLNHLLADSHECIV